MATITVTLPQELEISDASRWHAEILHLLANSDPCQSIEINASELLRLDCAGIQLLVSLVTQARSQNRALMWQSMSPELEQRAACLGLTDILFNDNS